MNTVLRACFAVTLLSASSAFAADGAVATDVELPPEVIIMGNARSTQPIAHTADMTVTKAILTVGGYAEFAHVRIYLIRDSKSTKVDLQEIVRKPEKGIPLKPSDIIYIK